MKLSMEILADKLAKYKPVCRNVHGGMGISGVRLLEATGCIREDILYVMPAESCFGGESFVSRVLCVHKNDWLWLDTGDADAVLAEVQDIFERFDQWDRELDHSASLGLDIQHLIDISSYALPYPMYISDMLGNLVGYTRRYGVGEVDAFWDSIVLEDRVHERVFSDSLRDAQNNIISDWAPTPRIYVSPERRIIGLYLTEDEEIIGAITIIECDNKLTEGACQLAGVFRDAASAALQKQGQNAELRTMASLARSFLDGNSVDATRLWNHILSRTGGGELELFLMRSLLRSDFNFRSSISHRLDCSGVGCFAMPYRDYVVAVASCRDEATLIAKMRDLIYGDEYLCGISLPFTSAATMHGAVAQAELALRVGEQTPGSVSRCVDHAYSYLLARLANEAGLSVELPHPALPALKKYDEQNHTSLFNTLYHYLRLERNVVATARKLFIHRNSMINRLQRIQHIMPLDLDDLNVRMYLMLSYQVYIAKNGPESLGG